jgi:hypothetical protein
VEQSLYSSGVDISRFAVAAAQRARGTGRCVGPCFQQASATALPFHHHAFNG